MKTISTILLASSATLLAALGPTPAAAADGSPTIIEDIAVRYGDIDLAAPAGAAAMLARLEAAASDACGGRPRNRMDPILPAKQRAYRRCRIAALDAATLQLGAPLVRSAWLDRDETARHLADARQATAELLGEGGAGGVP